MAQRLRVKCKEIKKSNRPAAYSMLPMTRWAFAREAMPERSQECR